MKNITVAEVLRLRDKYNKEERRGNNMEKDGGSPATERKVIKSVRQMEINRVSTMRLSLCKTGF